MKQTLAIISPNDNVYSETFIQAHKKLPFSIKYYYSGWFPGKLEGYGSLFNFSFWEKLKLRVNKKISPSEHALVNSLLREKVDCVLAEYGPTACECLDAIRYLQLPMLVHFHGFDATHIPTLEKYSQVYGEVFRYASAVIAVSVKMKNDLVKLGCPTEKIVVTPCGPAELFFTNEPVYHSYQFIAVGRFVEKKAPHHTIEAFKKVHDQFPQAELVMVGEGPLLESCKALAGSLLLAGSVHFKGVCTPGEIKKLMENAVALVQHSVISKDNDSEGTPVAVLEAQAAALPVIATDHAGISDVIVHRETGLLCNEHDVETMAAHMLAILKDKDLARLMGQAGRKRISENFTLQKHLAILESQVNEAIVSRLVKN